ncbi:MAG: hypothetical protein ACR2PA_27705 [Hyphomicrobiaceae bacterium]
MSHRDYVLASFALMLATCYVADFWSVFVVSTLLILFCITFAAFLLISPTWSALSCASLVHFVLAGTLVSLRTSNPIAIVSLTLFLSWFGQIIPLILGAVYVLLHRRETLSEARRRRIEQEPQQLPGEFVRDLRSKGVGLH